MHIQVYKSQNHSGLLVSHIFSRNGLEAVMITYFKKDYILIKEFVLLQNGKMLSGHPSLAFEYIFQN